VIRLCISDLKITVNSIGLTKYWKNGIWGSKSNKGFIMLGTVLLIILILLLIGAIPRWNYNRQWGYAPFGGVMTILIIILILWALGII